MGIGLPAPKKKVFLVLTILSPHAKVSPLTETTTTNRPETKPTTTMKKTVTAPLGPAAQRKADQAAARLARKNGNGKPAAKKAAKKAPAKKAAKKAAKTVTPPAARKGAKLDMSNMASRVALGFTAVHQVLKEVKAGVEKEPRAPKRVQPEEGPKRMGRPDVMPWHVVKPKHWQTMTNPEIAGLLGCTPPAVKSRRLKLMAEHDQGLTKAELKAADYKNPYACLRPKGSRSIDVDKELKARIKDGRIPAAV